MTKWISVGEKLPELDTMVLCFNGGKMWGAYTLAEIKIDEDGEKSWHVYGVDEHDAGFGSVSHWMPLPDAPKESE